MNRKVGHARGTLSERGTVSGHVHLIVMLENELVLVYMVDNLIKSRPCPKLNILIFFKSVIKCL